MGSSPRPPTLPSSAGQCSCRTAESSATTLPEALGYDAHLLSSSELAPRGPLHPDEWSSSASSPPAAARSASGFCRFTKLALVQQDVAASGSEDRSVLVG